jgi:hypothetical protein
VSISGPSAVKRWKSGSISLASNEYAGAARLFVPRFYHPFLYITLQQQYLSSRPLHHFMFRETRECSRRTEGNLLIGAKKAQPSWRTDSMASDIREWRDLHNAQYK